MRFLFLSLAVGLCQEHREMQMIYVGLFCILQFCQSCLLFQVVFLLDSLEFSKYITILSVRRDNLVSSLPILIPSVYFSSLIVKASISSTKLNHRCDNGHSYFTPGLIWKASILSLLHLMLADGFTQTLLIILTKTPFNKNSTMLPSVFLRNRC